MDAPPIDPTPIAEHTAGYMTKAFPTLFPNGEADFRQPRANSVTFGQYVEHLMRFEDGRFARHERFMWWAFNTLQRQRARADARIFVRQRHDEAQLTVEDLRTLMEEGDRQLASKMMRYATSLRGTRAFWLARRKELMDMITVKKSPHLFFTLSAADLQWPDLHKHMPDETVTNRLDDTPETTERRKRSAALIRNPHIAAEYLDIRVQLFMKHVVQKIFDVDDFWYRYEWQKRGSGHVHGFLWIKNAPDPDSIDWSTLRNEDARLPDEEHRKMDAFVAYWDQHISAASPTPLADKNTSCSTAYGPQPCSLPTTDLRYTKDELRSMLGWVERHMQCVAGYCLKKKKVPGSNELQTYCRFDYPKAVRERATVVLDSLRRTCFEPQRNDPYLNAYNPAMILAWRANIDVKPVLSSDAALNYIAKYASKAEQDAPEFHEMLATIARDLNDNGTVESACQKLLNKMLGERAYPAQEVAHLLYGIPLVRSSVSFQNVYLGADGSMRQLASEDALEGMELTVNDGDQRSVTGKSILQRYMERPPDMNDMSLHDVLTGYTWNKSRWRKRRQQNVIVRAYPRFSPDPDDDNYEDYCRTKVHLHHPFAQLDDAIRRPDPENNISWRQAYAACQTGGPHHVHPRDTLRCWENENRDRNEEEEDEGEWVMEDIMKERAEDWQILAGLGPNANLPRYGLEDLGLRPLDDGWDTEEAYTRYDHVDKIASYIQDQRRLAATSDGAEADAQAEDLATLRAKCTPDSLNVEQRAIFDIYEDTYRRILDREDVPQQLLNIDGTAGCGKTHLIRAICFRLRDMATEYGEPDPIRVLAPSGVAALNISGQTVHSACSVPIPPSLTLLSGTRLAVAQQDWKGIHFVIIDEKSMLGCRTLGIVDGRLKQLRPSDLTLGGFHVSLVGDFAQLPPVGDTPLYAPPPTHTSSAAELARMGSIVYHNFKTSHRLKTVVRQEGNSPEQIQFRDTLRHASEGKLSMDEWRFLIQRHEQNLSAVERNKFRHAPHLYTTRREVAELNLKTLLELGHPCARVKAVHTGPRAEQAPPDEAGGLEPYLVLSKGAKVMISRNLWQQQGLVNATTGYVEDIVWTPGSSRSDLPLAAMVSCPTYTGPTLWRTDPRPGYPDGIPIVPVAPMKSTFKYQGKHVSRTQLPLRLAWAVTVHKSQGLTIPKAMLSLGPKEFTTGLTFVALSRVKKIDDLMICGTFDYTRVRNLGGQMLQYRLQDFTRRYPHG